MKILKNPFIVSGYVSADYFCDREVETEELTQALVNGRNTVIVSPPSHGQDRTYRTLFPSGADCPGILHVLRGHLRYRFAQGVGVHARQTHLRYAETQRPEVCRGIFRGYRLPASGFQARCRHRRARIRHRYRGDSPAGSVAGGAVRLPRSCRQALFGGYRRVSANRPVSREERGSRSAYSHSKMYQYDFRIRRQPAAHDAEYLFSASRPFLPERIVHESRTYRRRGVSPIRTAPFPAGGQGDFRGSVSNVSIRCSRDIRGICRVC